MASKVPYYKYLKKTLIWIFGNFCFGIGPIIFLRFVISVSQGKVCTDTLSRLIHEGAILFVCCAMMGSVVVDFYNSGFFLKGSRIFATYISPFIILFGICVEYLLVIMKVVDDNCFDTSSKTTIFVVTFTFFYCLFIKTNLMIKEDTRNE